MISLQLILSMLFLSLMIGITAFVYSYILTQPGEVFSGWFKFLDTKVFRNDRRYCQGKDMHPLFKPLIGCEKCVSGQMAMIIYTVLYFNDYRSEFPLHFIYHILFTGTTIFLTTIIKSIYKNKIEINN